MLTIDKIKSAAALVAGNIIKTPLVHSPTLSSLFGAEIYLKLENFQKTGSFKVRGAANKILSAGDAIGP